MSEKFILFGKKKKETLKDKKTQEEYDTSVAYLAQIKREDSQQKVINQAKQERFKRSKFGKVVTFLDEAGRGKTQPPFTKKKKRSNKDAFFGGKELFRW